MTEQTLADLAGLQLEIVREVEAGNLTAISLPEFLRICAALPRGAECLFLACETEPLSDEPGFLGQDATNRGFGVS